MSDKPNPSPVAGDPSFPLPSLSPAQREARALFKIVKRQWYEKEALTRPRRKALECEPAPWQSWLGTPYHLPNQVGTDAPPHHPGSSAKIDADNFEIAQAFRPRPFLLTSGDLVLVQEYGWVCPLSTSKALTKQKNRPAWVVELPELGDFCLAGKIHMVDSVLYENPGERELLTWEGELGTATAGALLAVLPRVIRGAFAPKRDPVPAGSILRSRFGAERIVLATVALDALYNCDDPLVITARLRAGALPVDDAGPLPGVVPLLPLELKGAEPEPSAQATTTMSVRFVDLIDTRTLLASKVQHRVVGRADPSDVKSARDAWIKLLP